jgi:hypothetical protein
MGVTKLRFAPIVWEKGREALEEVSSIIKGEVSLIMWLIPVRSSSPLMGTDLSKTSPFPSPRLRGEGKDDPEAGRA